VLPLQLPLQLPLPHSSLQANQNSLTTRNFSDDWLGLFKDCAPALSGALSFHQLSNSRTASAFSVAAMATHRSVCFFALQELRLCSLNLSIATSTSAYSSLIDAARDQTLVPIPFPSLSLLSARSAR
jgi:hypothetical protein